MDQSKITKWELHILTHLIKYPNIILRSYSYTFFPPTSKNPYFWGGEEGLCNCLMCKKYGPEIAKAFIKPLVQKGFLQNHKYIKQDLSGSKEKRIRWTLIPEAAEQIPELKELMVQKAVGAI